MIGKNKNYILKTYLVLVLLIILLPMVLVLVWSFTSKWPWPNLLPSQYSFRAFREVFAPYGQVFKILTSSILLSMLVAILSTIVACLTARALIFYDFFGKGLVEFLSVFPNLVPGTVFAMGIHSLFIKWALADTVQGLVLVHLIYTLPYTINIMTSLGKSIGTGLEEQAYVLGVSPFKSFIYISLPLLIPGILASITMAYISSFSQYFLSLLIGGGNIKTFNMIMVPFIAKGDRPLSSSYALVFVLSTLLVFILVDVFIKYLLTRNKRGV